jgi:hypothetical protein
MVKHILRKIEPFLEKSPRVKRNFSEISSIKSKKKKAQSLMISYVILVAIVIAISIGVFIWLRQVSNIDPVVSCKEGTSILLTNLDCSSSELEVSLKNNGRFSVDGFILTVSNKSGLIPPIYLMPSNDFNKGLDPGSYFFYDSANDNKLKPDKTVIANFSNKEKKFEGISGFGAEKDFDLTTIKSIQIQPFLLDRDGIVICQDALIKQDIECSGTIDSCSNGVLDPGETGIDCGGSLCPACTSGYTIPAGSSSHYTFDVDAGDGTLVGGATIESNGRPTNVLVLNGIDGQVNLVSPSTAGSPEVTLSMWINLTENLADAGLYDESDSAYWQFSIADGIFYTRDSNVGPTGTKDELSLPSIPQDEWHHLTFVYSVSNNLKAIYLDGSLAQSNTNPTVALTTERTNYNIGSDTGGDMLEGSIDDFMIYNRALDPTEINGLYCAQGGTTGC